MKKPKKKRAPSNKPVRAQPKLLRRVIKADGVMKPKEYLACLQELGLTPASQRTAMVLGNNVRQCQRFASGDAAIPEAVARLLAMYIKHGLPPDARES